MLQTTTVEKRTLEPQRIKQEEGEPSSCWCNPYATCEGGRGQFQLTHPQGVRPS